MLIKIGYSFGKCILNFRKAYNWKIIIIVAGIIIYPAVLTAHDRDRLYEKTNLRIPLLMRGNARHSDAAQRIKEERHGNAVDKLTSKMGRNIVFQIPNGLNRRYRFVVQRDFIDTPIREQRDRPEYMIYAATIPEKQDDTAYPVAMITGIFMDTDDATHFGWAIVLDYPSIYKTIKILQELAMEHGKSMSLFSIMRFYIVKGDDIQLIPQVKFLYFYLKSLFADQLDEDSLESDKVVVNFFENAPQNLRGVGIGNAIMGFFSSFVAVGGKIKFSLFHDESLDHIFAGRTFEDTFVWDWFRRLGYRVIERKENIPWDLPKYTLEKTEQVPLEIAIVEENLLSGTRERLSCSAI